MTPSTRKRLAIAGLGAAGALAIGIAVPAVALAQEDEASPSTTQEEQRTERQERFAEALAEELGLDVETVTDALANVRAELSEEADAERTEQLRSRLDEAVADGTLTQEQADAILEAIDAGVLPGGGGHGFGGPGGFGGHRESGSQGA